MRDASSGFYERDQRPRDTPKPKSHTNSIRILLSPLKYTAGGRVFASVGGGTGPAVCRAARRPEKSNAELIMKSFGAHAGWTNRAVLIAKRRRSEPLITGKKGLSMYRAGGEK